jgi:branched-chain amino acid transport system substrate-binding protein
MKKSRVTFLILTIAALLTLTGAALADTPSGDPIYFAWAGPITGDMKQYGDTARNTIEIALKDINDAGGILGRPLVIDYYDDKNDATEAINVANQIIDSGKYAAVLGHFSSTCSMAVAPLYDEAKLINYAVTASHADLTHDRSFVFRGLLTQANEARKYADYLYTDLNIKSTAVLYINDDWGKNVADHFVDRFKQLGGTVTAIEGFIPGQTKDFTPMISKIKATNPDSFYPIAMYADTSQMLIQADSLNFNVPKIAATSCMRQEFIEIAGPLAENVLMLNIFPTEYDGVEFRRVMDTYQEKTGKMGDFHVMAYYNAMVQLKSAFEKAGVTDSQRVRDVLAAGPYEGLTGVYQMSPDGDCLYPTFPATVKNGKFARFKTQ